jgi:hypothetical protein
VRRLVYVVRNLVHEPAHGPRNRRVGSPEPQRSLPAGCGLPRIARVGLVWVVWVHLLFQPVLVADVRGETRRKDALRSMQYDVRCTRWLWVACRPLHTLAVGCMPHTHGKISFSRCSVALSKPRMSQNPKMLRTCCWRPHTLAHSHAHACAGKHARKCECTFASTQIGMQAPLHCGYIYHRRGRQCMAWQHAAVESPLPSVEREWEWCKCSADARAIDFVNDLPCGRRPLGRSRPSARAQGWTR